MSSVARYGVVREIPSSSTQVWIRFPHLGYLAFSLFLLGDTARHGHLFEITLSVLCTGGRDLVGPLAVEAAGNTTARIDAFDGLGVVRKDAVALGTLVMVGRGPARGQGRGLWLSRNWGHYIRHLR